MSTVAIIPARGGSKGIPRKNLRPLAGKPLIYYSIAACLSSGSVDEVVVTTDDDEIALISERFGARVILRDPALAGDLISLDDVIVNCADLLLKENQVTQSSIVITVQPTSPLILPADIDTAVNKIISDKCDTVISVVDDRHLCWTVSEGIAIPAYKERVNRQQLKPNFRETGAIIACTYKQIKKGTRIGSNIALLEIEQSRSFDIDNYSDFFLCESILKRKKIVFTVIGYPKVGLGHAFRAVMLANELINYEIVFICEEKSQLAQEYIQKFNYKVHQCPNGELLKSVLAANPNLVVNDILNTESQYVERLKKENIKVINFEDLGSGIKNADLVINALYPSPLPYEHVKVGYKYFCLRDEFLYSPKNQPIPSVEVKQILITFGGVDEGNLTERTSMLIAQWCKLNSIKLTIILGPGYKHSKTLFAQQKTLPPETITIIKDTKRISEYMIESDLAITSGGRTVLELASLNVPTIVICQNEREESHIFASEKNGIINLGLRTTVNNSKIFDTIIELCEDKNKYQEIKDKVSNFDLSKGKQRVCGLIHDLIEK